MDLYPLYVNLEISTLCQLIALYKISVVTCSSIDPLGPTYNHYFPTFKNRPKQKNQVRIVVMATDEVVGLAEGIIDETYLVMIQCAHLYDLEWFFAL